MTTNNLSKDFYSLLKKYPNAYNLVKSLENCGEILLFGGAIREYNDNRFYNIPRDFDLVIKRKHREIDLELLLKNFNYKKNRFDGYKVKVDSLVFDIWELEKTWAFKEKKVQCSEADYSTKLQETVFLNIDAIVYNLTNGQLFDTEYKKAMKDRVLDIVLLDNPHTELNMLRAILFKQKYNMKFSDKLISLFKTFNCKNYDLAEKLYELQLSHYSTCRIDKETLKREITDIVLT